MPNHYGAIAFTPAVRDRQRRDGSRAQYARADRHDWGNDALGAAETEFIAARDTLFLATVGADGWPYVQHRGGPPGFVRVLSPHELAFPDFRGNRQLISAGNLDGNDRAALLFIDFARRQRLKVYARLRVVDAAEDAELLARLALPGYEARVERAMVGRVEAFDWNCPQHLTPRFSAEELAPLRDRIAELEAEVARLRAGSGTA